jgi:hypothetical protein
MKSIRILIPILLIGVVFFIVSSCSKEKTNSRLSVYLTDAPGAYDAVHIDIVKVQIKASSDQGDNGWQELPINAGIYNLLDFTNGMDTLLSSVELPSGRVSQLRLILGDNNTITLNGSTFDLPLETPSAQTSGLKFNIHADLIGGIEYKLWIDIDVARSILVTGNNSYKLKPVIRTFTEALAGAIKGNVQPAAAQATVYAISGTDSLSAIPDAATGDFLIRGIPAGTWNVVADGNNGYLDQTVSGVAVSLGEVAVVDTITLTQ